MWTLEFHPVMDVRHLRTEANFENVAARQRYLEKLQIEMNTLRSWSNSIQDQITREAHQVHLQLMRMTQEIQRHSEPWAHGWMSGPPQPTPRPVQPTAQPSNVIVKPVPTARPQPQQASSSSMSSAPTPSTIPTSNGRSTSRTRSEPLQQIGMPCRTRSVQE